MSYDLEARSAEQDRYSDKSISTALLLQGHRAIAARRAVLKFKYTYMCLPSRSSMRRLFSPMNPATRNKWRHYGPKTNSSALPTACFFSREARGHSIRFHTCFAIRLFKANGLLFYCRESEVLEVRRKVCFPSWLSYAAYGVPCTLAPPHRARLPLPQPSRRVLENGSWERAARSGT